MSYNFFFLIYFLFEEIKINKILILKEKKENYHENKSNKNIKNNLGQFKFNFEYATAFNE